MSWTGQGGLEFYRQNQDLKWEKTANRDIVYRKRCLLQRKWVLLTETGTMHRQSFPNRKCL